MPCKRCLASNDCLQGGSCAQFTHLVQMPATEGHVVRGWAQQQILQKSSPECQVGLHTVFICMTMALLPVIRSFVENAAECKEVSSTHTERPDKRVIDGWKAHLLEDMLPEGTA